MRRRIVIALLAFGTIGGFLSGFASLACHHHRGWGGGRWGREGFDEHVSEVCRQTALRVYHEEQVKKP
jgi:hypothetical protein